MKKTLWRKSISAITTAVVFVIALYSTAAANVTLPWFSSYSCNDWNRYGDALNCNGLSAGGSWTCSPQGYSEQITSAANNPRGGNGKGQRHWIGDSRNNNSGGTVLRFANKPSELWLRWYMKWQPGFKWGGAGFKVLYFFDTVNTSNGFIYLLIHNTANTWTMYTQTGDAKHYETSGGGWTDLFPGDASDGSWHHFEVHIKRETTSSSSDGVWEMWVDGVKKASFNNVNYGMAARGASIDHVLIGSNSGGGANGGCAYVDFDDVAANSTGYIGPLSGTVAGPVPSPPVNLR